MGKSLRDEHRQQYMMFLVDNRAGYPQRWLATMASVPPGGYKHHLNIWDKNRTSEYDVYIWGEPMQVTEAQTAVLRYWTRVMLNNAKPD